jgi:transcriptional regulator with XRE-family HTH domain
MAVARPPIGAWIKMRRQQLGMKTQAELAARIREQTGLRVSRTSVANWEAGVHYPERYMGALEAVLGSPEETSFVPADDDEARIWAMDEPEEWRRKLIAWKRQGQARAVS